MSQTSQTTMKVSKETLNRLREHGKMGDTYEDVVTRLLEKKWALTPAFFVNEIIQIILQKMLKIVLGKFVKRWESRLN